MYLLPILVKNMYLLQIMYLFPIMSSSNLGNKKRRAEAAINFQSLT